MASLFIKLAEETKFINSVDLGRKLEKYAIDGHFMTPRTDALHAFSSFVGKYSKHGHIGSLSIDHIMRMARLILDKNYFVYQNKYYRQIRGGAMGSAFTQVLANIYMFEWEQELIGHQHVHQEMYGRYVIRFLFSTRFL